ncbi:MAG: Na+/H+ antiporter subunit E [Gammaproteobacteria bacterium]|nr:Na+/H+ antiporter subunit E [Gammaproteobacteria bacterium]
MKHAISLTAALLALWLLMSGHYDALLISLGIASTLFTVFLALRMEVVDHESYPVHMTGKLVRFWAWLSKEIVLANIDVAIRILKGQRSISPRTFTVKMPQQTDLGRVIYANSITLTPGTVSMRMEGNEILVHALARETAEDLEAERMARRVPEDKEKAS